MKVVILCGGLGTRLREETEFKPKPLVEVGGRPILWHIMKIYAHCGFNEFVLALGYKGNMIKDYFLRQRVYLNDLTLDTKTSKIAIHDSEGDDFRITFVNTGEKSLTGERVRRVRKYLSEDDFMLTYGDGVADINIGELVAFHKRENTIGTITGVKPLTRFGVILMDEQTKKVREFHQTGVVSTSENALKLQAVHQSDLRDYINGGFMVFKKEVLDYIAPNSMIEEVFVPLSKQGQLAVFVHDKKWKAMDTYRDAEELNGLWETDPFWKAWK